MERREGQEGMAGVCMRCAGHRRSRGPRYLLGSREGMVEARHVSHNGFLIRPGSSDDVCGETEGGTVKATSVNTRSVSQGDAEACTL